MASIRRGHWMAAHARMDLAQALLGCRKLVVSLPSLTRTVTFTTQETLLSDAHLRKSS